MMFVQKTTGGTAICNNYWKLEGGVNEPNKSFPVKKNRSLITIEFNTHKIQWVHNSMEEALVILIEKSYTWRCSSQKLSI